MRHLLILLCLTVFSGLSLAEPVGVIVRAAGDVIGIDASGQERTLQRRDAVAEGDEIRTGANAYVTLKFADQAVLELAANSSLVIAQYRAETEPGKPKILMELLSGKLRTITGTLATEPEAFGLVTASASIGVRGTEFEVWLLPDGGTEIQRHAGTVLVRNRQNPAITLELNAENPLAAVRTGLAPQFIDALSSTPLGPFTPSLLNTIGGIVVPPLPVAPPPLPIIVPLAAAVDADESDDVDASEPIQSLIALMQAEQWLEARMLADELIERYEGQPRFDLYHGMLLVHEARFDEAIFAFERVLIVDPDHQRARLELGHAYYQTGNYSRARDALMQVLATSPPNSVQRNINSLLARIDQRERAAQSRWITGGSVFVGWDSNANGGSSLDGKLDPNLLSLTELDAQSKPLASGFAQWSVNSTLQSPTSQRSFNQLTANVSYRNLFNTELSDSLAFGLRSHFQTYTEDLHFSAPIGIQWSALQDSGSLLGLDASLGTEWSLWGPLYGGVKIGSQVNISVADSGGASVKDLAGLTFSAQERGRSHVFSALYLQTQRSGQDDGHLEWRGIANRYQMSWALPLELQGIIALEHQWHRYKSDDLLFTVNEVTTQRKRRQDNQWSAQLNAVWSPRSWVKTQTLVSIERLNSNINAYSRDRFVVSQAVSVQF